MALGERHVHEEGFVDSLTGLAAIAARTETLQLGTAAMLPGLYNPLHIAETIAAIHELSDGRASFGAALGYRDREIEAFGVEMGERVPRLLESLTLLNRFWSGETVTHDGDFWSYDEAFVSPAPEIVRVHAWTRSGSEPVDVEDGATIQIETASGALGSLTCGYYLREGRYDTGIDIYGSGGRSEWDPIGSTFGFEGETTLELDDASGDWESTPHQTLSYEYEATPGYGGRWGLQFIEDSLDGLATDGTPPVGLDDALTVLEVLDAVYESASTGEWIRVDA